MNTSIFSRLKEESNLLRISAYEGGDQLIRVGPTKQHLHRQLLNQTRIEIVFFTECMSFKI